MKKIYSLFARIRSSWAVRHEPERFAHFAAIYWGIILLLTAISVCTIVIWGVSRFLAARAPVETGIVEGAAGPAFDKKQLEKTVAGFKRRAEQYTAFKTAPPQFADPSK